MRGGWSPRTSSQVNKICIPSHDPIPKVLRFSTLARTSPSHHVKLDYVMNTNTTTKNHPDRVWSSVSIIVLRNIGGKEGVGKYGRSGRIELNGFAMRTRGERARGMTMTVVATWKGQKEREWREREVNNKPEKWGRGANQTCCNGVREKSITSRAVNI